MLWRVVSLHDSVVDMYLLIRLCKSVHTSCLVDVLSVLALRCLGPYVYVYQRVVLYAYTHSLFIPALSSGVPFRGTWYVVRYRTVCLLRGSPGTWRNYSASRLPWGVFLFHALCVPPAFLVATPCLVRFLPGTWRICSASRLSTCRYPRRIREESGCRRFR